jgi:hypothetical protein
MGGGKGGDANGTSPPPTLWVSFIVQEVIRGGALWDLLDATW